MTDNQMLQAAANAADYYILFEEDCINIVGVDTPSGFAEWNPLTDDGDAFRLAVKLGISIESDSNIEVFSDEYGGEYEKGVEAWFVKRDATIVSAKELYKTDPDAATRRAIVRAAAEIGKNMPNKYV